MPVLVTTLDSITPQPFGREGGGLSIAPASMAVAKRAILVLVAAASTRGDGGNATPSASDCNTSVIAVCVM